jgi:hypothetical protein
MVDGQSYGKIWKGEMSTMLLGKRNGEYKTWPFLRRETLK